MSECKFSHYFGQMGTKKINRKPRLPLKGEMTDVFHYNENIFLLVYVQLYKYQNDFFKKVNLCYL